MNYVYDLHLVGAEIGMTIAALVLLLVSAWLPRSAARAITIASVAALFGACFFTAALMMNGTAGPDAEAFGGLVRFDAFAGFAKLVIYLATIACLIVTPRYFEQRGMYRGEYPVLMLLSAIGMGMMVSAIDLMTLYIGLELSSLSSYVLASFARNDTRSAEAGLKYFVLGALASGILLYGMSLIYGFTGSTNYAVIREALAGELGLGALFGVVFVLAGLAFKVAAVPFHMWTPDVYQGAPTPVTAFFASASKISAAAVLARMALFAFGEQLGGWQQIVIFAALASIILGALGAIGQEDLKRVLAYSSINNVGFLLIGLATGTVAGASAMLTYLAIYAAMTIGSFVALLMLTDEDGTPLSTFADLSGLASRRPALALCILVLMFSLAGIPPLFGFWAKFVVFQAAVEAGMIALAAIAIAASVIGAFYYIKFVKVMYFDTADAVANGSGTVASSPAGHWGVLAVNLDRFAAWLFVDAVAGRMGGLCGECAIPRCMREPGSAPVRLRTVATTGSTNADLLAAVAAGEPTLEGEWLLADRQTAGRGRQGRQWHDGFGNFMGSTSIRLTSGDPEPASLSLVVGLALFETVAPLLPVATASLKWPNDLLAKGTKLGGVLLERVQDWVVVGVGVNLANAPRLPDRATVALSAFGPVPDRDLFATNLAQCLASEVERWRCYGLEPIIRRWQAAAHPAGTPLTVQPPGEALLHGRFDGLQEDGSLRLRLGDGSLRLIAAGDVMLAGEG